MPPAREGFTAATGPVLGALSSRLLTGTAINRSSKAWATTVYNAEGLIVSVPNPDAASALQQALSTVLTEFSCRSEGPPWLPDPSDPADRMFMATASAPSGALVGGVKLLPGTMAGGPAPSAPDPWDVVETLRGRLATGSAASVGLNHLMSAAEQVGGNPLAVGHGRVGLDSYGSSGWGGHGPVALLLPSHPPVPGRRPRVVVLDTGIGDHPWFRADPAETTVRFADGRVVGPNISSSPPRHASRMGHDSTQLVSERNADADLLLDGLPSHAGHGTFIAGLLRQACPAADIVALTVMSNIGIVPEHKLIRALDVLRARQRESPGWADAIVLSLGYYAETGEDVLYTSGLKDILLDLGRLGVAVFAAAGNDATRRPSYPAALAVDPDFADPDVLPVVSVAALNSDGTVAPFSNDGPWVTAEALGVNLVSASPVGLDGGARPQYSVLGPGGRRRSSVDPDDFRSGYAVWSGTSFATPLLAGEYLRRVLAEGFPTRNDDRRALLPLGRRARADSSFPTVVVSA